MKIDISVVVPVYNVENTLDRCLNSILNQTFKNYEVILVDDGSTDRSGVICDLYVQKYSNFRVIHKKNEGLGPTRNVGIREARGEYIYHCDSDDWLKEDLLQNTYDAIVKDKADVVVFGYEIFTQKGNELKSYNKIALPFQKLLTQNDVRDFFIKQYYYSFIVLSACNRLYRKKFLEENNLYFPPLRRCQDMAYSLELFSKATKITVLPECYYCYIIEPGIYKGRSFNEMVEIYMNIHQMAEKTFIAWGKYNQEQRKKLVNQTCGHIANYTSYAITIKYVENWKEHIHFLMAEEDATKLFCQYSGSATFIKLFSLLLKKKRKYLLKWLCMLQQKKVRKNNQ